MKKTILLAFDFDGTLVTSHEQVHAALVAACTQLGVKLPSVDVLRRTSSRDLARQLGLGPVKIFRLLRAARKHINENSGDLVMLPGLREFIASLAEPFALAVLSSNTETKIRATLEREGILAKFITLKGSLGLWSKKVELLRLYKKINPARALYIGDEERDIQCAASAGYQSVAVGWGFKDPAYLRSCAPRFYVENLAELSALIRSLAPSARVAL